MNVTGQEGLQTPTLDDVRRLLDCVHSLHTAVPADRPRVLAERLMAVLAASMVAVDAGRAGQAQRLATAGEPPAALVLPNWTSGPQQTPVTAKSATRKSAPVGRRTQSDAEPHPPTESKAPPSHEVRLLPAGTGAGKSAERPAGVQSIFVQGDHVSAVTAWRPAPFNARHVTLLQLIHPPTAWIYSRGRTRSDLPASTDAVLQLMLRGMPEKEIARRLGRSAHTVHAHVKRVYRHFGVRSRPQLLARVYETK